MKKIALVLTVFLLAPAAVAQGSKLEEDRHAILAMQGEYRVTFNFRETVALDKGYTIKPPKNVAAFETVVVVEDSPKKIVLQHLLVSDSGHVTKHWRQDWTYEAKTRQNYLGHQIWETQRIGRKDRKGRWTQCVYEVSDAPRYCGTGKWVHSGGIATWESARIWRPLPRREYTTRDDYEVLAAVNRHTITPSGWTHEQDNSKTVLVDDGETYELVRESGLNTYRKMQRYDFSPAYEYWAKTKGYWADVRDVWAQRFAKGKYLYLDTGESGMAIIGPTFEHAQRLVDGEGVADGEAAKVIAQHTYVGDLEHVTSVRTQSSPES